MSLTHEEIEELASKVGNPYWQIAYHDAQDLVFGLSPEDKAAVLRRADDWPIWNVARSGRQKQLSYLLGKLGLPTR